MAERVIDLTALAHYLGVGMWVLLIAALSAPADFTEDDLVAMFLENAMRAQTLRVTWSVISVPTSASRNYSKEMLRRVEEAKKQSDIPPDVRSKIEKAAQQYQRSADARADMPEAVSRRLDYWSDREHFQVRSPIDPKTNAPFRHGTPLSLKFPNDETTRERLATIFETIYILSFGPQTNEHFRSWDGLRIREDHYTGGVRKRNPLRDCFVPPLALPKPEWSCASNPIDEFYGLMRIGKSKILGHFPIDGIPTVLVEAQAGETSARAFVDVQHSALPRRIEFFQGPIHMFRDHVGLCVDHPKLGAMRIVKDIVIEPVGDTISRMEYPSSGLIQKTSRATSPGHAISTKQPYLAVFDETRWQVELVEINRSMSAENFALQFPANTIFANDASGELMVTGNADEVARRLVQGTLPSRVGSSKWWLSKLMWVGISVAAAAGWWALRLWRQRTNR